MSYHRNSPTRRRANLLGPVLGSLAAVVALIILFLVGTVAGNPAQNKPAAATGTKTGQPKGNDHAHGAPAKAPALGEAVRDGKFEFVVSEADCSNSQVGLEHLKRTATGKYCVVSLSVENIADRPQFFLGSAQKARDAAGATFHDDEIAGFYANRDTQTFLRKIDPGEKVVGKLVFDVPKATTLTTVELHDSFLSGGVQVTLK